LQNVAPSGKRFNEASIVTSPASAVVKPEPRVLDEQADTEPVVAAIAAIDSWAKMAGVLIFYVLYINVENAYLTPRIMRKSVDLTGLTVLIALIAGTELAGVTGALVAVPTAALVAVLLDEYLVQKDLV